jgi:hypothetical protein
MLWNSCSTEKAATANSTGEISKEPELEEYINQRRSPRDRYSGISANCRGMYSSCSGMPGMIPSGRTMDRALEKSANRYASITIQRLTMANERAVASGWLASRMQGCFLILPLAFIAFLPYGPGAAEATTIDTKMPASIPAEIVSDWELQDSIATTGYARAIDNIIHALPPDYATMVARGSTKEAYLAACHLRRTARIERNANQLKNIIYAQHYDLGGTIIGFTEDMDGDGYTSPCTEALFNLQALSKGTSYVKGSALMICDMSNSWYGTHATLLSDAFGVIRDPCLSYDATKVAFAWSKDNNGYHLYEIDIAGKAATQLTHNTLGLTVSDFEPCYLPNGDIVFNSSRCFGQVADDFNITSNLFLMNGKGKYLRRIGYDQVHTTYPTMMSNGKVLYSRWEYNDRNVSTVYGLFTMNLDGTRQMEYFGNQTSLPATLPQAREIPGTDGKVMATTGGRRGMYCGDLCIVDPNLGRNGKAACQLIAPKRVWPSDTQSSTGVPVSAKLFQNPYPLDAKWFLVSYRADTASKFRIYLMNVDKEMELIAWDTDMSVSQPIPLVPRQVPTITAYQADYTKTSGEVTMTTAYYGTGTGPAVKPNTIKKIRVIALEYRIYPWFGNVGSSEYICTPVARFGGTRESKRIVGEMPVESDGSAAFFVPARTPVYFQVIDTNGCAIQSMRSWVTLQPGERFPCYGCHEDKNTAPPAFPNPIAILPKPLEPFFDIKNDYLHYPEHIQPILDKRCVSCHGDSSQSGLDLRGDVFWTGTLAGDADNKPACRNWTKSYYTLTTGASLLTGAAKYVNFISTQSRAEGLRPDSSGSKVSPLITRLQNGHSGVKLTEEEMGKLCAWIDLCIPHSGYYADDMKPADSAAYVARVQQTRTAHELLEEANIQEFIRDGGYGSYVVAKNFHGGKKSRSDFLLGAEHFKVRFSLSGLTLKVQVPRVGKLSLMDIHGRRIALYDAVKNGSIISLGTKLPCGLYLLHFNGAAVNERRIVAVVR